MENIDMSTLRVYEGCQGEYADCGDYSKGTWSRVAERVYGKPWTVRGGELTNELRQALDAAPRRTVCG